MSEFMGPALPPDLQHEVIAEKEEENEVIVGPVLPPKVCSHEPQDREAEVASILIINLSYTFRHPNTVHTASVLVIVLQTTYLLI